MNDYELAEQNLNTLGAAAVTLLVAGMIIAFGSQISSEVAEDNADCSGTAGFSYDSTTYTCTNGTDTIENGAVAYNASYQSLEGMSNLAGKLPSVGLVIGAVVIVGLLIAGFTGLR